MLDRFQAVLTEITTQLRFCGFVDEFSGPLENNDAFRMLEAMAQAELEALVAIAPDWTNAPPWANWWACDPNGWACWYQEEPIMSLTVTYSGWVPATIEGVQQGNMLWAQEYELPFGLDWRILKTSRTAITVPLFGDATL